ncbi:RNA polymerase sigma factor, sigma-70 family [Rubellimicrobium thermophilum DSM 16684]|uniref:RNA polymerase sigma factor, sigma-70 family n=1 Tax=Rubellimicrobium thermophilum DSM 16684 TaxID=1123069 RepID=S9SLC0_9RHOB|nr:sigma-70 family RNA polymerase sigma factor [Rubellimicrobium thermophilum]EPX87169.1 RNA polymerase sigma factor, sigma-70 family [Rubellimicrobium thermophilum DSM 16684]
MTSRQAEIEQMIARMAMGDRQALSALYAATSAKLFAIAVRVLEDRTEAEDALQDIYVKIWHNADRYQVNGLSPMTWLITIARNHAIDRLRARRRARPAPLDEAAELADLSPSPEEQAAAASMRSRIEDCLRRLQPEKADAVRRAYLRGETYEDLARRYGIPLNTIRTWLRRSLLKLRECLGP